MAQVNIKNCTIKFKDGTSNTLTLKVGEGTLTWSEKRNIQFLKDRGLLDTVREGDKVPVEVNIDLQWVYLSSQSSDTVPTPEEVLKQTGEASAWVTSDADTCKPYAIDIEIFDDVTCGGTEDETITLSDFRYESIAHDLRAGTLKVSGKCNISEATVARS